MKNMKKTRPASRHEHVGNDSQTEEISGRGSKVTNLPTMLMITMGIILMLNTMMMAMATNLTSI